MSLVPARGPTGTRYTLPGGRRRPPSWGRELAARLWRSVGHLPGASTVARLHAAGLSSTTAATYSGHWARWQRYCESAGEQAIPASPATVLGYLGHLAEQGTVAARSLQPYFSAINRVHRDFDEEPPALGHHLRVARQGLGALQLDSARRDARTYLPAPVADKIVRRGLAPASGPREVRRCAAVGLAYLSLQRVSTSASVQERDVGRDDTHLWFRERFRKGQEGRQQVEAGDMRVMRYPLASPGVNRVWDLIARWRALRGPVAADRPLFAFPGETTPTKQLLGDWLAAELAQVGERAPEGFTYTYHSLRHGGATGAYSVGVPELTITCLGGWSRDSTSARRYIDFTCAASAAAHAFFGWLTRGWEPSGT